MLARLNTPLRLILQKEGRTQAWLARELDVHRQQVGDWVHGIHRPAADTQARIAALLGRTVDEVFPDHDGQPDGEAIGSDSSVSAGVA